MMLPIGCTCVTAAMASKVRCSACKDYFEKDEIKYRLPLGNACSDACLTALRKPSRPSRARKAHASQIPEKVREEVFQRDQGCRWCGGGGIFLAPHHIIYRSQGGPHISANLIVLCQRHHDLVHSDKNRYQPILFRLLQLQYVEHLFLTVPQVERMMLDENYRRETRTYGGDPSSHD